MKKATHCWKSYEQAKPLEKSYEKAKPLKKAKNRDTKIFKM